MAQPDHETEDAREKPPAAGLLSGLTLGGDAEVIPGDPCEPSDEEGEEPR